VGNTGWWPRSDGLEAKPSTAGRHPIGRGHHLAPPLRGRGLARVPIVEGGRGAVRRGRSLGCVLTNRSIPTATVIPVLVYADVRAAVDWLTAAFGFVERVRIGEAHRSQMRVGDDGAVIVADVRGEQQAPQPGVVTHVVKVRVPDVDAQLARARSHGARVLQEPTEYEYGERECTVEDLGGHRWQFTQTLRDVAPEEWGGHSVEA
jgi:uncharacterized glyoxalase superfamily protein PhnB